METALIAIGILNLFGLAFCVAYVWRTQHKLNQIKVVYSHDAFESKGFIKNKRKVTFKGRVFIGELPVGEPFVLSVHEFEEVSKENVDHYVKNYIAPTIHGAVKMMDGTALKDIAKKVSGF